MTNGNDWIPPILTNPVPKAPPTLKFPPPPPTPPHPGEEWYRILEKSYGSTKIVCFHVGRQRLKSPRPPVACHCSSCRGCGFKYYCKQTPTYVTRSEIFVHCGLYDVFATNCVPMLYSLTSYCVQQTLHVMRKQFVDPGNCAFSFDLCWVCVGRTGSIFGGNPKMILRFFRMEYVCLQKQ